MDERRPREKGPQQMGQTDPHPSRGWLALPAAERSGYRAALVALGLGLAVLVARQGSPLWTAVRVLVVTALTLAAWAVVDRKGPAARGTVALLAGLVGIVVGVPLGGVQLVRSGATVAAVAGCAVLASGVVLLVAGSVTLVRLLPGWWRLLAVPVGLLLVQFVLLPLPFPVYATNAPPTALGDVSPADAGLDYRTVAFATADGVVLSGWYLPSRNGAVVALLHGSGSTRADVLPQAIVLSGAGYGVLMYDDRGHGRSGGTAMDFGWWGDLDLRAAVDFLVRQPDVDARRIGAVGISMGGEQAVNAAANDDRIRVVVAEGVEPRLPEDLPRASGLERFIAPVTAWEGVTLADLLTDAPRPMPLREAVRRIAPRPVLLIAASGEARALRPVRDAAPRSVTLWELTDTPHVAGLAAHPAEWTARVSGFLDAALRAP